MRHAVTYAPAPGPGPDCWAVCGCGWEHYAEALSAAMRAGMEHVAGEGDTQ